jgi:hypothetical protein
VVLLGILGEAFAKLFCHSILLLLVAHGVPPGPGIALWHGQKGQKEEADPQFATNFHGVGSIQPLRAFDYSCCYFFVSDCCLFSMTPLLITQQPIFATTVVANN